MKTHTTKKRLITCALAALVVIQLAGCADNTSASSTSAESSTPSVDTPQSVHSTQPIEDTKEATKDKDSTRAGGESGSEQAGAPAPVASSGAIPSLPTPSPAPAGSPRITADPSRSQSVISGVSSVSTPSTGEKSIVAPQGNKVQSGSPSRSVEPHKPGTPPRSVEPTVPGKTHQPSSPPRPTPPSAPRPPKQPDSTDQPQPQPDEPNPQPQPEMPPQSEKPTPPPAPPSTSIPDKQNPPIVVPDSAVKLAEAKARLELARTMRENKENALSHAREELEAKKTAKSEALSRQAAAQAQVQKASARVSELRAAYGEASAQAVQARQALATAQGNLEKAQATLNDARNRETHARENLANAQTSAASARANENLKRTAHRDANAALMRAQATLREERERYEAAQAAYQAGGEKPVDWNSVPKETRERIIEVIVLDLLNKYRQSEGLPPVMTNDRVMEDSRSWSREMAAKNNYNHANLYKTPLWQHYPVNSVSENIYNPRFYANENPIEIAKYLFVGWKNSDGHNANMLEPGSRPLAGVGVFIDQNNRVWATQRSYGFSSAPHEGVWTVPDTGKVYGVVATKETQRRPDSPGYAAVSDENRLSFHVIETPESFTPSVTGTHTQPPSDAALRQAQREVEAATQGMSVANEELTTASEYAQQADKTHGEAVREMAQAQNAVANARETVDQRTEEKNGVDTSSITRAEELAAEVAEATSTATQAEQEVQTAIRAVEEANAQEAAQEEAVTRAHAEAEAATQEVADAEAALAALEEENHTP